MKEIDAAQQTRRIASALERIEVCYGKLQSESSISFRYGHIDDSEIRNADSTESKPDDSIVGPGPVLETEISELETANSRISELEDLLENAVSENAKLKAELDERNQASAGAESSYSNAVAELKARLDSMVGQQAEKVSELDDILSDLESLLAVDEQNA